MGKGLGLFGEQGIYGLGVALCAGGDYEIHGTGLGLCQACKRCAGCGLAENARTLRKVGGGLAVEGAGGGAARGGGSVCGRVVVEIVSVWTSC